MHAKSFSERKDRGVGDAYRYDASTYNGQDEAEGRVKNMHLHELLKMSIQDYELERKRIEKLFERTEFTCIHSYTNYDSLKDFLSGHFLGSRLQGTALNIKDFFSSNAKEWGKASLESLLLYCEVVYGFIAEFHCHIKLVDAAEKLAGQIFHNITIILEKTGHELRKTKEGFWEIVKKDALASVVIEDLSDADAAMAVLDYNHFGMKGNVAKKRELLVAIGRYVEPLTDDAEIKGSHSGLVDDVKFCLNNLHIRHNNEDGKFAKDWLEKMSAGELESWYDKAYRSMLLLIEEYKQLETHRQINALKKQGKISK